MATTTQQALGRVNKLYETLVRRRPGIREAYRYFVGEQPLVYATDQWKAFHSERYRDFADNWCGVVGQAPVDRLRLDGFSLGDNRTPAERALWDDWKRNDLELQSKQGFQAATIAKRSATLVWGDPVTEEPRVTFEHPEQFVVAYTADGRDPVAALKAWTEDATEYATLYTAAAVWKFQRPSYVVNDGRTESGIFVPTSTTVGALGGWTPRQPSSDDTWPIPNPLGEVPVVEWLNRPLLGGEPLSDIAGTMAMQNAINLLWAYMFTAADHASMPARVVTGTEPPKIPILDKQGQIIGSKPAKLEDLAQGRLLFLPGSKAGQSIGIEQWESARLDVFDKEIATAVAHVAAQTSTPGHYLLTNDAMANLNGDALTAAEVPLATKVENAQAFYGPAARRTLRLMAKVRGEDGLADALRLADLQWKDAAMHSLAQVADAATKDKSIGMSTRTILETRYGMGPDRVEQEMARIREEQTDPILAQIMKDALANPNTGASA